jgi:EAL domain-containing protein (putative c-di-GMP-specific phosphodiesterase class I)
LTGRDIRVGISLGGALCPLDAQSGRDLIKEAALAVIDAKHAGGRCAVMADRHFRLGARSDPEAEGGRLTARGMEAALRAAIGNGELALHFQPYFDLGDGAVQGFEALLRWTHPRAGTISPAVFIPVAEASGLIGDIDRWVLLAACKAAQGWAKPWQVAVNLSAHWFGCGLVVDLVADALNASGLVASRLELELTERTLIANRDSARGQIESLRESGAKLAMDDFGTGYSSLGYLRQFPFDKLKLDRSFIAPLGEDPRADDVARAIIQLGRSLHMRVCAEGVENMAQLVFLRREGCDLAQGYLLGRPAAQVCGQAFELPQGLMPRRLFGRRAQREEIRLAYLG